MLARTALLLLLALAAASHARPPPPRILLYTPLHVSEPTDAVRAFAACLFGKRPSLRGLQFDVLVSVSGAHPDGRDAEVKEIIANAAHTSNVAVTFTALEDDTYALALSNDHRKDAEWVSGPNAAFYGALLSGPVYDAHTRHYDLVQQLETDVCAMADGWLDVLVEPMLRDVSILVSGARTACDCVYDAIHDACEPMSKYGDHMLGHVNGNALYRVGKELSNVLTKAQAKFDNTEPFDLAVYWTLKEAGMLSRLHANPRYLNTPCLVDRARFILPAYRAVPDAVAVHAPRRLRTTSVQAVASRGLNRGKQAQRKLHTLTVVALTHADADVLKHQQTAFGNQFVDGVVYVATDRATYDAASRIAPLRVVAAFGDGGLDAETRTQPGDSSSTNHHHALLALEAWPPSATPAGTLMTAVARIINLGHDVFFVGMDAVPLANYGGKLAALDRSAVHVAGVAKSDGAASLPAMAYLPASAAMVTIANEWASMLRQGRILTHKALADLAHNHGTTLSDLPWSDFVVHGPLLASGWPGTTLKRRAIVAVGSGEAHGSSSLTAFRHRAARLWPRTARVACTNYSVLSRRPGNLTSVSAARVIRRHAQFAAFVAAKKVECAVVPGFALPATRSRVDVGSVLDLTALAHACGNATLLPSRAWIEPGARRIKFTPKHGRGEATPPLLPLVRPLESAARSVVQRLGTNFTCVRDPRRSLDEVASLTLGTGIDSWIEALRQRHGLSAHRQLLLTGAWKAVRSSDIIAAGAAAASLLALADVVSDGLPHRLLTPVLASTPFNPLLDPAWADVVEGWVCAHHATTTVDAEPAFPPPQSPDAVSNVILPHIPASVLRRDLDALHHWRQRDNRLKSLRPPPIAVVGEDEAVSSPTSLPTLRTLADMQSGRLIVLPFTTKAGPDTFYTSPNILPPSVLSLTLPRLAPVLASRGALSSAPDPRTASVAADYPAEMALVKRLAHSWSASVVWTAPGRLTLTEVLDAARVVPSRDAIVVVA